MPRSYDRLAKVDRRLKSDAERRGAAGEEFMLLL
jgi:hypothetical protein